jgi:hypothetical protein
MMISQAMDNSRIERTNPAPGNVSCVVQVMITVSYSSKS